MNRRSTGYPATYWSSAIAAGTAILSALMYTTVAIAADMTPPPSRSLSVRAIADIPSAALPAVDVQARLAEDAADTRPGPLRYAIASTVSVTPQSGGLWETAKDGSRLWRQVFSAKNATDINFGFTDFHLPAGAQLFVYSATEDYFRGPYTAADNKPHREFWTAMLPGDTAVIELHLSAALVKTMSLTDKKQPANARGGAADLALHLTHVGAGYRDLFGRHGKPNLSRQGACNIDVICAQGDQWRDDIRSVGNYSLGGSYFCTGTIIMDVAGSFTPFFLTANHCDLNAGNAPSLVVLWNFEASVCGALSGGSLTDTQSGATFRAAKADVDFTLLELDSAPDPAFGVYYAGWDATGAAPLSSVGISHPSNDEKALAFNDDTLTTTNSCIGPIGIGNTHWNVDNYEEGMTEPGSSGSGIWNPYSADPYNPTDRKLVGILSGGSAACAGSVPNTGFDCYGKFSVAWSSGSSAADRLRDWLDPTNTGTLMVNGADPAGGGICGDSLLDAGEQCDDGNSAAGDGCSDTCQIEAGFTCTAPVPPGDISAVPEGGFESGTPSPAWAEFSTNFGTPLCDGASCGLGGGTGPFEGLWWLWFGGTATVPEVGSVEQTFTFPTSPAIMTVQVENPVCDSGSDFARILIDGNVVFSTTGADPSCGTVGYREITIDLATAPGGPYNTGTPHTLRAESEVFAVNTGLSNFFFDQFLIDIGDTPAQPSVCTAVAPTCYAEDFDPVAGSGFVSFLGPSAVLPNVWGDTGDGFCNSVNGPPGNHAGTGVAACSDSDAAGNGILDAYLCSPAIDLGTVAGANLEFLYNYQVFSATAEDLFEVTVGTTTPVDAASVAGYTQVLATSVDTGTFGVAPGAAASIDISAFDGLAAVHVCYRHVADFDWYAQVDDVRITATDCNAATDTDTDGIADNVDNCIDVTNPSQRDTDGDGHGNRCDADLNNDCIVNPLDLGLFKLVFFTADPDADFNGDGVVNPIDLGIFKSLFFTVPGASAPPNLCGNLP